VFYSSKLQPYLQTLDCVEKINQEQTLYLIGANPNLQCKLNVVNTAPGNNCKELPKTGTHPRVEHLIRLQPHLQTLDYVEKFCQELTIYLIGSIPKLQ
jgi:hypothetical protein